MSVHHAHAGYAGMNWTQPICERCWEERNPSRPAHRLTTVAPERCCHCAETTVSGIYVRVNPRTVAYPRP